jgi:Ca-activated chloride channel family protein
MAVSQGAASGGSAGSAGAGDVGFAAGGAKDVANFRQNIEEGYLPLPTDISYEGLFYDYYFDTGGAGDCDRLFCPRYSTAVSPDPLSGEREQYLTVGLDSGLDSVERKRLTLVVVLDVSGSMDSAFDQYYYDRFGNEQAVEDYTGRTKIDVATDAVASLTEQLDPRDRFGMVVYNDGAYVAKPIRSVRETDMDAIRGHLQELRADGGTNLSAGVDTATQLFAEYTDLDPATDETRMVVCTDAMPNRGELTATADEGDSLRGRLADNAQRNLYTTFIGVGVDFNTELVDAITAIEGANYYSVHSADQFEARVTEEFTYMVTPLVFDLSLTLDAAGYDIAEVYGSTAAEEATGEMVHVNTLFPSPTSGGKTRGGVVLAKLARTDTRESAVKLTASWRTRTGTQQSTTATITFPDSPTYDNSGIRKAILLARYADLLKEWALYEREHDWAPDETFEDDVAAPPEPPESVLGRWERQSDPLTVSPRYRERFETFHDHFQAEMNALDADPLQQELSVLSRLTAETVSAKDAIAPRRRAP